jgi:hypothetical protein
VSLSSKRSLYWHAALWQRRNDRIDMTPTHFAVVCVVLYLSLRYYYSDRRFSFWYTYDNRALELMDDAKERAAVAWVQAEFLNSTYDAREYAHEQRLEPDFCVVVPTVPRLYGQRYLFRTVESLLTKLTAPERLRSRLIVFNGHLPAKEFPDAVFLQQHQHKVPGFSVVTAESILAENRTALPRLWADLNWYEREALHYAASLELCIEELGASSTVDTSEKHILILEDDLQASSRFLSKLRRGIEPLQGHNKWACKYNPLWNRETVALADHRIGFCHCSGQALSHQLL